MSSHNASRGFTLVEVAVAVAVFLLFALGIYSSISLVFKIVYQSRMGILETAILSEQLEIIKNLSYDKVGIVAGVPSGIIPRTQIITRNGVSFTVVTTIRNIDDPYDGLAPVDTAPADYKLVEMSAICGNCSQSNPVIISTIVGPKNLEGASYNGSLFINVFDSNGLSVVGAKVHVVNSSTNPITIIDDVTDNQGNLKIIDTPTGTQSYMVNVSKLGYSSDYTVPASQSNPNPARLPANVVSQTVTSISFSIDRSAVMNIHSMNASCVAIPNAQFSLRGDKLIGTSPSVYKYNQKNLVTDGTGLFALPSAEWDKYYLNASGTIYDLAGTIPLFPFSLNPSVSQEVSLLLVPHTNNSLLVKVKDAGTGLPLSNATVELSNLGLVYDQKAFTGLSYSRQTDWSGGAGQILFIDPTKYFFDDGNVDALVSPGDIRLRKAGNFYVMNGKLESSTIDLTQGVNFQNVIFEPLNQPAIVGSAPVTLQIATSNSSTPATWNYLGPDGTVSTYYTPTSTQIFNGHNGNRYLRYKLFLSTANTTASPQVSELTFTYTNSCNPPGQLFFNGLPANPNYTLTISKGGFVTSTGLIGISGYAETTANLSGI